MLPLLLVDGYNVLFSRHGFADPNQLAAEEIDPTSEARDAFLGKLATLVKGAYETIVVFDGATQTESMRKHMRVHGLEVRFSTSPQTADSVLEALATEAREQGRRVCIATNDMLVRQTCAPLGVQIFSVSKLLEDMHDAEESAKESLADTPAQKMTVADRLDSDTLKKLKALLDDA